MKKVFKCLFACLLAITMSFSTVIGIYAADTGTLQINNTIAGKEIELYQMFSATKNGENVAYTLNQSFESFFTDGTGDKYKCSGKTAQALSEAAYDYVSKQTTAAQKEEFSKEVLAWLTVQSPAITVTSKVSATNNTTTITNLAYGYYVVYPKGATQQIVTQIKTPLMLVSITTTEVKEITMKSTYPTVDKSIITKNDNNVNIGIDDSWEGNNDMEIESLALADGYKTNNYSDAQVGDTVSYQLTSTIPDMTGYSEYNFSFKDTLSKGLTFSKIVKVTKGDTKLQENTDYTFTKTSNGDGTTTIVVTMNDFYNKYKNNAGETLTVSYTAELNESAVVGMNPNDNSAVVEYSNDPSNSANTVPSVPDVVPVYTFDFTINKYFMQNATKTALSGAGFKLYSDEACTKEITLFQEQAGDSTNKAVYGKAKSDATGVEAVTPANGNLHIKGLDAGEYYLKETTTPSGYNELLTPIKVEIKPSYTDDLLTKYDVVYTYNGQITTVSSNNKDNSPTIDVENKSGTELPSTGGTGTVIFTIAGIAIISTMVVLSVVNKKKKEL